MVNLKRPPRTGQRHSTSPGDTSSSQQTGSPIYARLVAERGDIPTETRRTAEQIRRDIEQAWTAATYTHPPK
jgi:hypothetical protein